jgi:RNA polymerase primary sigma factor
MVSSVREKKQKALRVVGERKQPDAAILRKESAGEPKVSLESMRLARSEKSESARPKRASKPAKVSSKPFVNPDLNSQLSEYTQLVLHNTAFGAGDSQRAELISSKLEFIENPTFESADAEHEILEGTLLDNAEAKLSSNKSARLTALPSYLARLCEARLLKPEQEVNLFRRMNYLRHVANKHIASIDKEQPSQGDFLHVQGLIMAANWHRDLIVKSNMRLVISIVKKFANPNNTFDDLLSDGIMALIKAVEKFDFERGFRFSTYATQVVRRNAYRNVMTKQKDRVKIGTSLQDADVDLDDRYSATGMSPEIWHMLRSKLALLLDKLDRREKFIVRARFSLGGHRKVQTLQKIANSLGVSKERIRQLEKRALDKLRDLASLNELPEFITE